MTAVRVFDPAMCCSTGVCGPSPLSTLVEQLTAAFDVFRGECTTADDVTLVGLEVAGG